MEILVTKFTGSQRSALLKIYNFDQFNVDSLLYMASLSHFSSSDWKIPNEVLFYFGITYLEVGL